MGVNVEFNVLQTLLFLAVAAILGAGADLIKQYIKSGKVTPEHAKKEDLDKVEKAFKESFIKLEGAFNHHVNKHGDCEKNFVAKEVFEKHLHDCPIKEVVNDINRHRVDHGIVDTRMDQRLSVIENFATETHGMLQIHSDRLNEVNTNLQVMIQEVKGYRKENGNGKK
jgi:hypothetical protein